jgi:DNA mismatch repair ATPase MutS
VKAHLLFADSDFDVTADLPPNHEDLIQDLELKTLLDAMADGDTFLFAVSERTLLASLIDPEIIKYRQRVLSDCIAHPEVIRQMYAIAVGALEDRRRIWGGYGDSYQSPSSNLSGAVSHLEAYVVRLRQLRQVADENVNSFESAGLQTLLSTLQHDLDDDYFEEVTYQLKQLRFRNGLVMSAELGRDNSGINFVLRASASLRTTWKERLGIAPRSSYSFTLVPRDEAGGHILQDLTHRGINLVADAAARSADHIKSYFTMLRWELGFYVSCLNLKDRLAEKGVPMSFPEPLPQRSPVFLCADLRDACLALRSKEPVVGNDVDRNERSVVIITGANSGGKSTFLRSVGLAHLMMQCGLFVSAQSFGADVVCGVFTHFIREEDPTMTSGRLDEELGRMSTIADQLSPHCLMLFNESFAGTNEREGSEIARQVVHALLEAKIKVFFVTHRFDFAQSFSDDYAAQTLFLRAERRSDSRPNYKLVVKEPLPTSFGEDVYYRLGGWLEEDSQVVAGQPDPADEPIGSAGIGKPERP